LKNINTTGEVIKNIQKVDIIFPRYLAILLGIFFSTLGFTNIIANVDKNDNKNDTSRIYLGLYKSII
jgi:hypothetical protein